MQSSWSHGSRRDGMHAGAVRGHGAEARPWGRGEVRSGGGGGVAGPTDRQTERRSGTRVPGTRETPGTRPWGTSASALRHAGRCLLWLAPCRGHRARLLLKDESGAGGRWTKERARAVSQGTASLGRRQAPGAVRRPAALDPTRRCQYLQTDLPRPHWGIPGPGEGRAQSRGPGGGSAGLRAAPGDRLPVAPHGNGDVEGKRSKNGPNALSQETPTPEVVPQSRLSSAGSQPLLQRRQKPPPSPLSPGPRRPETPS